MCLLAVGELARKLLEVCVVAQREFEANVQNLF